MHLHGFTCEVAVPAWHRLTVGSSQDARSYNSIGRFAAMGREAWTWPLPSRVLCFWQLLCRMLSTKLLVPNGNSLKRWLCVLCCLWSLNDFAYCTYSILVNYISIPLCISLCICPCVYIYIFIIIYLFGVSLSLSLSLFDRISIV